ncbi:tRNA (guanosine(46)-N7)-methyltransferase TrmB [Balneolaceae bacterium ANBcel3]|nr:tRNA (guanosine(46)-N7)-methyltransferase TrmB [Balneolaceae bacterium ANBcel3]
MGRLSKPERYEAITQFPNVSIRKNYRDGDYSDLRGNWHSVFGNNQPITLELACGKGDYAIGLAQKYPNRNYIGIDIKGDRIWKGATQALQLDLKNVHFLRARIDHLCNYFAPGEVSEIWITFPDPFLKSHRKRKRLTHPVFLKRYARVLKNGHSIHLKTDSERLYLFTCSVVHMYGLPVVNKINDIYRTEQLSEDLSIQTYYEKKHLEHGAVIRYLCFQLNEHIFQPVLPEIDDLD